MKLNLSWSSLCSYPCNGKHLQYRMMSPKAVQEYGKDYSTHAAGTGPLKLKEWIPGTSMSLEKNENYWGDPATADTINIKIIAEDSARAMMLKTGDADVAANIPSVLVNELESDPNVAISMVPGYRTIYLGLNFQDEKLSNLKVREAIDYAIDRDAIINGIFGRLCYIPVNRRDLLLHPKCKARNRG